MRGKDNTYDNNMSSKNNKAFDLQKSSSEIKRSRTTPFAGLSDFIFQAKLFPFRK